MRRSRNLGMTLGGGSLLSVGGGVVLEVQGLVKSFGGVQALRGANLSARTGEILALMGENGSGKSTLVNILAGRIQASAGHVQVNGRPVEIHSPQDAHHLKIALVSQELQLAPSLTVAENIFLGHWPGGSPAVAWSELERRAIAVLDRLQMDVQPRQLLGSLSLDRRQMVEIARALARNPDVLLLDEPTSALTSNQVDGLFAILRQMRTDGKCVVFVSHRLREVFGLADRVLVLRDGKDVATSEIATTNEGEVIRQMVGRPLQSFYYKAEVPIGEPVLEVSNLSRGFLHDISFSVRAGEIVGVAGLAGSGRSALARTLFGLRLPYAGEISVSGAVINPRSPGQAMRARMALVPEDRKGQGLCLSSTVRENMLLADFHARGTFSWLSRGRERRLAEGYVRDLSIRTPSIDVRVGQLSGGNQQKVVLAKWLLTDPRLIILDEPTNGIDVGAKAEIYHLIGRLAAEGRAILLISSEMPELLALSDRILTMYRGRITAELSRASATEELVGRHILAGT